MSKVDVSVQANKLIYRLARLHGKLLAAPHSPAALRMRIDKHISRQVAGQAEAAMLSSVCASQMSQAPRWLCPATTTTPGKSSSVH